MSPNIIVKKFDGYNHALGKHINSQRDYIETMKRLGCMPSEKVTVKKEERKPYEMSKWGKEMVADISNRKGRKPGERFLDELSKRGYDKKSYEKAQEIANGHSGR